MATPQQKQILDSFVAHGLPELIRHEMRDVIFHDLVSTDPEVRARGAAVWEALGRVEQIINAVRTDYAE